MCGTAVFNIRINELFSSEVFKDSTSTCLKGLPTYLDPNGVAFSGGNCPIITAEIYKYKHE